MEQLREELTYPNRTRLKELLQGLVIPEAPLPPTSNLTPFSVQGTQFIYQGKPFKFIGVNSRELAFWGVTLQHSTKAQIADQLTGLQSLGVKVVRFYAAHRAVPASQAASLVRYVLDELKKRDMFGIVVLADGAYSGYNPPEVDGVNRATLGINRYTERFYLGGYEENYLPYAKHIVQQNGNHDAIFAWEPANELTTINTLPNTNLMNAYLKFYEDSTSMIRQYSPTKMIGTGLESAWQLFSVNAYGGLQYAKKLYQLPNVDFATVHTYEDQASVVPLTNVPNYALGSARDNLVHELALQECPLIIEEFCTMSTSPSPDSADRLLRATFPRASGFMWWNTLTMRSVDNGSADCLQNKPSEDPRWHHHSGWIKGWADQLKLQY